MASKIPTTQAAEEPGITRVTLQRWIRARKMEAPAPIIRNGRAVRLWSKADIERMKKLKESREGQGRRTDLNGSK